MMKRKILFIDRDGTLIHEPEDKQIDSLEKLSFMPYLFSSLSKINAGGDWDLVMVSNQDGLGTNSFPEETFWPAQEKLLSALRNEGIEFKAIHIDRSFDHEQLPTRKPRTGMLTTYMNEHTDLLNSIVIGDRLTDIELAKNLGCKAILLETNNNVINLNEELDAILLGKASDWRKIVSLVRSTAGRSTSINRKTKETDINVYISLDGEGQSEISTGISFFDHMLDQLARHGSFDLRIQAKGDLQVDEHHTIEDTGITLGEAFGQALGNKRGISRYGFCLPMDDCLAQTAIDLGGRPWLVWDADFKREKIGEMPTEMFMHFFKSFSDAARCNLNIRAEGQNEHHKIEAIFKSFAKALRMAVKIEGDQLPTTKGII